ncbi:MAG: tRNA (cytidine(56)-2'-O)-methyltransferase [Candidatus Micrarchaeota archaeon]
MIVVLRWGHRAIRDERITSHVCLVARAFGADKVIVSGENAGSAIKTVRKISKNWGGSFEIEHRKDWKKVLQEHKGRTVHLTMYGEHIQDRMKEIRKHKDLLIIVGSQKVPPDIYQQATYNIAITNQPHSEVSSLAIFMHEYFQGKELENEFPNAKVRIKPNPKGKSFL